MRKESPTPAEPSEYRPNFVFGGNRVISEATWAEYEAQGVSNIVESITGDDEEALRKELDSKASEYGGTNILLGDAFDKQSGRPLQHKPGVGIYATAEGMERYRRSHTPALRLDGRTFKPRPGEQIESD